MVEFFVQLPRPLATVVKAARRRYGGERFARAFAVGLDLARRAQGWDTPSRQYKDDDRVTVRFAVPDADYTEIQRLKSFFGRARWEIVAAGVRFALCDNAGNIIAYVARGDGVDAGPSGPRVREDGRGGAVAVRRKPGGPGSTPGAGLLALAASRRGGGPSLQAPDAVALARATGRLLGSRTVEATVLFADVRGFTAIAEAQGPEGTVAMLNDYFARMTAAIAAEGGMLDKFIGDAIMAGFGVPLPHDDDPDRAAKECLQAWKTQAAVTEGLVFPGKDGKPFDRLCRATRLREARFGGRRKSGNPGTTEASRIPGCRPAFAEATPLQLRAGRCAAPGMTPGRRARAETRFRR